MAIAVDTIKAIELRPEHIGRPVQIHDPRKSTKRTPDRRGVQLWITGKLLGFRPFEDEENPNSFVLEVILDGYKNYVPVCADDTIEVFAVNPLDNQ